MLGAARVACVVSLLAASRPAWSQVDPEVVYRSAVDDLKAGRYAEACPKFAESQRIDPKLGTLMNLALCHEKQGKTASAWAEYIQAAQLAARAGQADREQVARQSAAALDAVLPHIILKPDTIDPITVKLDGQVLGAAALGTSIPIDPGPHEIIASAAGHIPFTQTVTIPAGHGEQTVAIPKLALGADAPPAAVAPVPPVTPATPPSSGPPILGYSLIGGGVVLGITGAIFGALALSDKSSANGQCNAQNQCTQSGLNDISAMKTAEATSTLTIGAGILAAGAGLFFVLRHGHGESSAPAAQASVRVDPLTGPHTGGLSLSGTF